jgi:hypothetical protein
MAQQVTDPTKVKLGGKPQSQLIDTNGRTGGATNATASTAGFWGWTPGEVALYAVSDVITPVPQPVNPNNK